jgi:hypothetical protein
MCLCLPCSSLQADATWFVLVVCWNRWSSSSCSPVLVVLAVFLPLELLPMKWLGFGLWKVYICPALASLVDNRAWHPLVTPLAVCVLLCMHTPGLAVEHAPRLCEQLVCVCGTCAAEWISSAGSCHIHSILHSFANLPMPLVIIHLFDLWVCLQGTMRWSRWRSRSSWARIPWWSSYVV